MTVKMNLPDWTKKITESDLPDGELAGLACEIGLENFVRLLAYFNGAKQYIPRLDQYFIGVRNRAIREDWKWSGKNLKLLMQRYDLTDNQIRKIVNDHEDQLALPLSIQ